MAYAVAVEDGVAVAVPLAVPECEEVAEEEGEPLLVGLDEPVTEAVPVDV